MPVLRPELQTFNRSRVNTDGMPVWRPGLQTFNRSRVNTDGFLQHEWAVPSGNTQEPHSANSKPYTSIGARTFVPPSSPIPRGLSSARYESSSRLQAQGFSTTSVEGSAADSWETYLDCHPANVNVEQIGSAWPTQSDPRSDPRWTSSLQIPSPFYSSLPPRADSPRTAKTHGFVLESGTGPSSDSEARKPKRRGELNKETRAKASKVRSIGACWRCRLLKNQVRNICRGPYFIIGS